MRWILNFIIVCWLYIPSFAKADEFAAWLNSFRVEAARNGISTATLHELDAVQPNPDILVRDQSQPESVLTFENYVKNFLAPKYLRQARAAYADNRVLLNQIGKQYQVEPRFIVSLWGIESRFGARQGSDPIIPSLVTLAYQGRRATMFRGELIAALQIIDQGMASPDMLKGSWAGAMGQCQFMPSTFLHYAVDYSHRGSRDIWRSKADIFASIGNYLHQIGWRAGTGWGREVHLPPNFDPQLLGLSHTRSVSDWLKLSIKIKRKQNLPNGTVLASVIAPDGITGPAFLVYGNYPRLIEWNRSSLFALSVALVADRLPRG